MYIIEYIEKKFEENMLKGVEGTERERGSA